MTLTCKARFVDACDYAHNCCKKDYERRKKMKDCTDMEKRGKLYCDSNEETLKDNRWKGQSLNIFDLTLRTV